MQREREGKTIFSECGRKRVVFDSFFVSYGTFSLKSKSEHARGRQTNKEVSMRSKERRKEGKKERNSQREREKERTKPAWGLM